MDHATWSMGLGCRSSCPANFSRTHLVIIDTILPTEIGERLVAQVEIALGNLPVLAYVPPQVLQGHLGAAELTLYRRYFSRTLADLVG